MIGLLLTALLLGAEGDALVAELERDYQTLLADEPQAQQIREAAALLKKHDQGGLIKLRKIRPKAAVPLLLKLMYTQATNVSGSETDVYAATLRLLTGEPIESPFPDRVSTDKRIEGTQAGVKRLVEQWWRPKGDKVTTNLDRFSKDQMQLVVHELVKKAAWSKASPGYDSFYDSKPITAYRMYHVMYYDVLSRSSSDHPGWESQELHGAMTPYLLALAGYEAKPADPPRQDTFRIAYPAIHMLAALRSNGQVEDLEKYAEDKRQNSAVRMTVVLALYNASEKLRSDIVLELLSKEKDLERRLAQIMTLRYAERSMEVNQKLIELLDDRNEEIRIAAACALRELRPPEALPKLKRMIDELNPKQGMSFVLDIIGQYQSKAAAEILAAFLSAALEDAEKEKHLYNALSAFDTATGNRWGQAGANSSDSYPQKAKAALAWWKANRGE